MRRYDICIDCPAGSRVDEATLRRVFPEWVDAVASARRVSVQLRLPLLVPSEQEAAP